MLSYSSFCLRCFTLNIVVQGHILPAFTVKNMMLQIISSGNYFIDETIYSCQSYKERNEPMSTSILFHSVSYVSQALVVPSLFSLGV